MVILPASFDDWLEPVGTYDEKRGYKTATLAQEMQLVRDVYTESSHTSLCIVHEAANNVDSLNECLGMLANQAVDSKPRFIGRASASTGCCKSSFKILLYGS